MILEKLIYMICEEFGFSENELDSSSYLYEFIEDDGELEELVFAIESEFEIELENGLDTEMTIEELADMIEEAAE